MYKRGSGILAHPTSFETKYGIGDFGKCTIDFLDFLERTKQKYWQILPLGPTSFGDSPYQCFSTFAINTLLISPDLLLEDGLISKEDLFNELPSDFVDYGNVQIFKNDIYRKAFEKFDITKDKKLSLAYNKFIKENEWLGDYCLFIALKQYFIENRKFSYESDEYKAFHKDNKKFLTDDQIKDYFYGGMWLSFPTSIKNREPKAIAEWTKTLKNEIEFNKFLQFTAYSQWDKVREEAKKREIEIIGDIPIFVSMDSSDVWANKDLFFLDKYGRPTKVAGVPPDYFSETGQLWGNPLYDFSKHKLDGYKWWLSRIESTKNMCDIVRIDHFRGFAQYWAIPFGEETAINGKWEDGPGTSFFDAVFGAFKDVKIIAEDLGLLTDDVLELRDHYNLPGMKILQFAFSDEENDYLPHNFKSSNCVCYTGTHDNDTTVGFYQTATDEEKDYIRRYLNIDGEHIAEHLVRLCLSTVADISIVPIQDLLGLDGRNRMNKPSKKDGNWQFRFKQGSITEDIEKRLLYLVKLFNR